MAKLPGFLKDSPKMFGADIKDFVAGAIISLVLTVVELPPITYLLSFLGNVFILGRIRKYKNRGNHIFPLFKPSELKWVKED
ncbi:MAG: hypothetical protein HN566_12325 [Polaribacter sp.]|jgi:hypothetical protein|nr:hypothetical protein [Polaribacter sp.]